MRAKIAPLVRNRGLSALGVLFESPSPFRKKLEQFVPRDIRFLSASDTEKDLLRERLQAGLGGSPTKEDWGQRVLPCVDTLQVATNTNRRLHTLIITEPLTARITQRMMLNSPADLSRNLGRLAVAIEGERSFWFLCKRGLGETINRRLVGLDQYVNALTRPTTDMARWLSGTEPITLGDLAKTLVKGGIMGTASSIVLYASLTHPETPQIVMLAAGFLSGAGTVVAHMVPWADLLAQGYETYSKGEQLFIVTGQYTANSPEGSTGTNP